MNTKTSLVLMVLFMVFGTLAIFDPFQWKNRQEVAEEKQAKFLWLKDKRLESFRIKNALGEFSFSCVAEAGCDFDVNSEWRILSPVSEIGDAAAIGNFTSSLLNLNVVDRLKFDQAPDFKEFGLDKPEVELEVRAKGEAEPYLVYVGSAAALGPTVYVRTNKADKQVFLLANYFTNILKKDLFYWRNKNLFSTLGVENFSFLEWKTKGNFLRAEKRENNWRISKPMDVSANFLMMEGLVATLNFTAVKSVFANDANEPQAKKILAAKPEFEFTFGNKDKQFKMALYPAPGKNELIAKVEGRAPLYVLDGPTYARFQKELSEYRERTVISETLKSQVDEMHFKFPKEKKTIVLKMKEKEWQQQGGDPASGPLSQKRISTFFELLASKDASLSTGPEFLLFGRLISDFEVELFGAGKLLHKARFVINQRKYALSEGEARGEVRIFAEDFVRFLPVRFVDLLESNNKQVVITEERKGEADGHHHSH